MKIQYPGVAAGIQSDIENLVGVMKVGNFIEIEHFGKLVDQIFIIENNLTFNYS